MSLEQAKQAAINVQQIQAKINAIKFLNPVTLKPLLLAMGEQQAIFNINMIKAVDNG